MSNRLSGATDFTDPSADGYLRNQSERAIEFYCLALLQALIAQCVCPQTQTPNKKGIRYST